MDTIDMHTPPSDIFVAMRVGDVQKQSRLVNSRSYRFPAPAGAASTPFGRIEVYRRIGATTMNLEDRRGVMRDIEVPCDDSGFTRLSMRVLVSKPDEPGAPKREKTPGGKAQRTKKRMDVAQQYLSQHRLEELIADAMREVLHHMPDNPHTFLSNFILRHTLPRLDGAVNAAAPVDLRPSCPGAIADPSGAGPRLTPLLRAPSPPPVALTHTVPMPVREQPPASAPKKGPLPPTIRMVVPEELEASAPLPACQAPLPGHASKEADAQKAHFQRRFAQLCAQGLSANEAAAEALRQLRRGVPTLPRERDAGGARYRATSAPPAPPTPSCREAAQREMDARTSNARAP